MSVSSRSGADRDAVQVAVLYERAKKLQSQGLSASEIHRTLLSEGAREEDIKVILGSLGLGPQPHPDPTQQPLALARRVMESRVLRFAVYSLGAATIGAILYGVWVLGVLVWAIVTSFSQGR
jgi:hypothetical protein